MDETRTMSPLTREQSMRRLRGFPMGRVVFTHHALPSVRPVNHIIDAAGRIVIRSHDDAAIFGAANKARGTVVCYEADDIDPVTGCGWSVIVTGMAHVVLDQAQADQYAEVLHPWVNGSAEAHFIRIEPTIVTGYELTSGRP
jgi:hypothetical protein